jgi:hypothetical protein
MTDSPEFGNPRPRSATSADGKSSDSVLTGLGKATWSEEEGVSYEVALDVINDVVGAYSGLIGREEASPDPDGAKIASWRRVKVAWAHKRRELSPADPKAVASVRREAAGLLRTPSDHR